MKKNLKKKFGNAWILLLVMVFIVAAGGCGGGGDSGDSAIPSVPDIPDTPDVPPDVPDEPDTSGDNWIDAAEVAWYEQNPDAETFEIATAEDLAGLAKLVNDETDEFEEKTVILIADIDLSGKNWTPIGAGKGSYFFRGTFDGSGHTIANMKIKITTEGPTGTNDSSGKGGLFTTSEAIKDVHLTDFDITLSSHNYSADAGGLVETNYGTITGCTASGKISVSSSVDPVPNFLSAASAIAGGLVGSNMYGSIENCTANVDITVFSHCSDSAVHSSAASEAGGLVGDNRVGSITACTASGSISAVSESASSESYASVGGLVGRSGSLSDVGWESVVKDCAASGKNFSAKGGKVYLGGFIGENLRHTVLENNRNETSVSPAIGWDKRKNPEGPSDDI